MRPLHSGIDTPWLRRASLVTAFGTYTVSLESLIDFDYTIIEYIALIQLNSYQG